MTTNRDALHQVACQAFAVAVHEHDSQLCPTAEEVYKRCAGIHCTVRHRGVQVSGHIFNNDGRNVEVVISSVRTGKDIAWPLATVRIADAARRYNEMRQSTHALIGTGLD